MEILESGVLQSGVANFADLHRQDDGQFAAESGQIPHYESGILSAYPSPSDWDESGVLLETPPALDHYDVKEESFLNFDFLGSSQSQANKTYQNNTVNYLAPYIHYYTREETVVVPTGVYKLHHPVKISALNFVAVPINRAEAYVYTPPSGEE